MTQKDDDRQEELWQSWQTWLLEQSDPAGKEFAVIVAADHRDAQHLRERVRVLEEALREADALKERIEKWRFELEEYPTGRFIAQHLTALLLPSPVLPGRTEGGEGA